jgi:hypothetical protein
LRDSAGSWFAVLSRKEMIHWFLANGQQQAGIRGNGAKEQQSVEHLQLP